MPGCSKTHIVFEGSGLHHISILQGAEGFGVLFLCGGWLGAAMGRGGCVDLAMVFMAYDRGDSNSTIMFQSTR